MNAILMVYALSFWFVGTEGGTCPQMPGTGWMQILWFVLTFTLCSQSHSCQYLPLTSSLSFWQLSCKILHFFHQYMMACNYFWMLCEGIYLHTLIVVAVFTEEQHLRWYYLLGWGMYFFQLSFESPSPLSVNLQSSSSLGLKKWSGV